MKQKSNPSSTEHRVGEPIHFEVPDDYPEGERIDAFLADRIEETSRTKIQRAISAGLVKANGEEVKKSYPVEPGDSIVCQLIKPPPIGAEPEDIPLDIVYEDDHLIVVNKPAGMVVHPAHGHRSGTLVNALLHHVRGKRILVEDLDEDEQLDEDAIGLSTLNALPSRAGDPSVRPGIVHRLDKDTSGVMVVAKNDNVHRKLAEQFAERVVDKTYLTICWGQPNQPEGTIDAAVGRDPRNRKKMTVLDGDSGKRAVTHYETAETYDFCSLLSLQIETGRTHQIRVHLEHLGHPVLGDPDYGGVSIGRAGGRARKAFARNLIEKLSGQALHAWKLGFEHPISGEHMQCTGDLHPEMEYVLNRLRKDAEAARRR